MYLKGESMKKLKLDAYDVPAFISGTNDYYDVTEGDYIYHTIDVDDNAHRKIILKQKESQ